MPVLMAVTGWDAPLLISCGPASDPGPGDGGRLAHEGTSVPADSSVLRPCARWQSAPLFMIRWLTALGTRQADDESCEKNIVIRLFIVSQVNITLTAA